MMIKKATLQRIYVNNYKCCVNLEIQFDAINLLLGSNGVGKSTVFEVLRKIQELVGRGREVSELFLADDLTRWQNDGEQQIELEIHSNNGVYKYELILKHDPQRRQFHIFQERLWLDQNLLIDFKDGTAQLYRDNYSKGPEYPFDWHRSAIASLPSRHDNTKLTWFKERLRRFIVVQINPLDMSSESSQEEEFLDRQCRNFVSWYRRVSDNQGKAFEITKALQEILSDFDHFEFEKVGEYQRQLRVYMAKSSYRFHELSDGQRALIVLYSLIYFAQNEDFTLCIDEPENFVSLPEIQPWLSRLYDLCTDGELQALLISHHPEYINYLADSVGLWFERKENSPVRVSPISNSYGLEISELVARGWLSEQA